MIESVNHYRPQTKFAKVMFSQLSVCPQGGGLPHCMLGYTPDRYTPWAVHPPGRYTPWAGTPPRAGTPPGRYTPWVGIPLAGTPPSRYTPWADTPLPSACWDTHPAAQCMLGYTPPVHAGIHPRAVHPGIRSTSGRYASHWNAFLFFSLFDAGEERYRKLKETISRITPLQIGEYI